MTEETFMAEFIQLHFLTSYPPANLNRDDLGRPKTAAFGGAQRLRVSSQSLKRAWRTSEVFRTSLEGHVGTRTKELGNQVYKQLRDNGVTEERADAVAKRVAGVFGALKKETSEKAAKSGKKTAKKEENQVTGTKDGRQGRQIEQLAHISVAEEIGIKELVRRVADGYDPTEDECKKLLSTGYGSADIAL